MAFKKGEFRIMARHPLDTTQIEFPPLEIEGDDRGNIIRRRRWELRETAGYILPEWRVKHCGRTPIGKKVGIVVGADRGAYTCNIETCGSIWTCPVCAGKIAEGRRQDISGVMKAHAATGGEAYMITFTVPHNPMQSARLLRDTVAGAWRKLVSRRAYQRLKERCGIIGYIRALEVTHGGNGWHPHLHLALLTEGLSQRDMIHMKAVLFTEWRKIVLKMGLDAPGRRAFDFRKCSGVEQLSDYLGKWGADCELAKASSKVSKKGGSSPWQLLAEARDGNSQSLFLFREYAHAFKGARHLTWSLGLRDFYLEEPELSDEELACLESPFQGDAVIGSLRREVWYKLIRADLVNDMLDAAEASGWQGVLMFLRGNGLALPENHLKECYNGEPRRRPGSVSSTPGYGS